MNQPTIPTGIWVLVKPFMIVLIILFTIWFTMNSLYIGWDYAGYFWNVETWGETFHKQFGISSSRDV